MLGLACLVLGLSPRLASSAAPPSGAPPEPVGATQQIERQSMPPAAPAPTRPGGSGTSGTGRGGGGTPQPSPEAPAGPPAPLDPDVLDAAAVTVPTSPAPNTAGPGGTPVGSGAGQHGPPHRGTDTTDPAPPAVPGLPGPAGSPGPDPTLLPATTVDSLAGVGSSTSGPNRTAAGASAAPAIEPMTAAVSPVDPPPLADNASNLTPTGPAGVNSGATGSGDLTDLVEILTLPVHLNFTQQRADPPDTNVPIIADTPAPQTPALASTDPAGPRIVAIRALPQKVSTPSPSVTFSAPWTGAKALHLQLAPGQLLGASSLSLAVLVVALAMWLPNPLGVRPKSQRPRRPLGTNSRNTPA